MANAIRDVLTGAGAAPAPGTPMATVAGASNGTPASTGGGMATVGNTQGGSTSVARIQVAIGLGFLIAVAILVLLNRAGFKFSVTVGR